MSAENVREKQAIADLSLKDLGKSRRNPFYRFGQLNASDFQAVVAKLPHGDPPQIQDMNPASDTYGLLYFLPDMSIVDGPDVVI